MRTRKKIKKNVFYKINNERLRSALKFLIKFNLLAIPLYIIIIFDFQLSFLKEITTNLIFSLINAAGMNASVNNFFISIPVVNGSWGAYIDWDCTGWKSMYAMFALVFSTESKIRKKIIGLSFLPLIFIVNIVRIWFMFFLVKNYGLANYDIIHTVIWSWGLILTVLVLWIVWSRYVHDN